MSVSEAEIVRELKMRILYYFSSHELHLEVWTDIFRVTVMLYKEIIAKKGLSSEPSDQKIVIPLLISVLDDLLAHDIDNNDNGKSSKLEIDKETRDLITHSLKVSGISMFQLFYCDDKLATNLDTKIDAKLFDEVKFSDNLSMPTFLFLRQRVNLFVVNEGNSPTLISYACKFVKGYNPPIPEERQKKILYEVLTKIMESALKFQGKIFTKEDVDGKLKPMINSIYYFDLLGNDLGHSLGLGHKLGNDGGKNDKGKCCVIM